MKLKVNGREHDLVGIDRDMPLLWALRDKLNLTGTKYGCGRAQCGACTVHINGEAVRSCSVSVHDAAGKRIVTIEAVSPTQCVLRGNGSTWCSAATASPGKS
jgi:isoquinoline 1-oxidoreductase subunit alpha